MSQSTLAPAARRGRARITETRHLAWAEWGPEDGVPVLFCPGAGTAASLGFGADVVDELGARLIALSRPGLGGSDPAPGRTLATWAEDVRAFCAVRGLEAPRIVGFSQGAPFALACAAAGVVARAALVSGTDELAAPEIRRALPSEVAALVDRAGTDPAGAEAFFGGMTPSMLGELVLAGSGEADRAVYAQPAFAAAFASALAEGFAQGAAGYARDTVLSMHPWPFAPGGVRVPVDLWYGAHDASPVHSPDHGRTLAGRIPGARWRLLPDAGGALLWTHAREILLALVEGP